MSRIFRKLGGTPVHAIGFGAMGYGQTGSIEERLKVHSKLLLYLNVLIPMLMF